MEKGPMTALPNAFLALGTAQWGMPYGIANRTGQPRREEVSAILLKAQAAGVTLLDTAPVYGTSEALIGELCGAPWTVITKLHADALTADLAKESLAASRTALRRSVLDGVLLHRASQRMAGAGAVWDELRRERDAGQIRLLGLSALSPEEAWAALEDPDMDVLQVATNLFDQRLVRSGFFPAARKAGRMVIVRSVYLQGVAHLAPEELPGFLKPLRGPLAAARAWAAQRGGTQSLPFLAYAARQQAAVLVGCESVAQFEKTWDDWSLIDGLLDDVEALAATIPDLPVEVLHPPLWPKAD
jgi:aryl-alcohol dehydrogenase-like predicted oxidoreductase